MKLKSLNFFSRAALLLLTMMLTTVTAWAENTMYVIAEEISGTISISQTDANEGHSYFSANKIKLTFYYGERPSGYTEGSGVWSQKTASIGGSCIFDVPTSANKPGWIVSTSGANLARRNEAVVEVVFDASFAAAQPTSTAYWFQNMKNLTGLNLLSLNVTSLTNAKHMFSGCSSLANIYCEGNWNTSKLSTSTDMFNGCTSLPGYNSSYIDKKKARPQPDGYFSTIGLTYNTEGGYYEINDEQDLIDLGDFVGGCSVNHCEGLTFKLTADLDFTDMPTRKVNGNSGNFHPIGLVEDNSFDGYFSGHFDGQNHTIKGLRYANNFGSGSNNNAPIGLFKKVDGSSAVVERVILIDPQMSGKNSGCGGVAGLIRNGATIRNCTVLGGSITHNSGKSGGIVGSNSDYAATIEGCTVIGTSVHSGMIIGYANSQQTIKDCIYYTTSSIGIAENTYTDGGGNQRVYQLTLGEYVTATGATYSSALLPGKAYSANGATVTLGHNRVGYLVSYTSSDVTISNGAFIMPTNDVTVTATFTDMFGMADGADGSADHPYIISTTEGWNFFCDALQDNTTYNRFSGKTVKLGANIEVSRMAGSQGHDFCGTFDGDGKTLTFNYGTSGSYASDEYAAPFHYVSTITTNSVEAPADFRNLHVAGDIYTSAKYAAGLIAQHWGTVNVENCVVSTVIHSSVSGDGTHGGFEAMNLGVLNITGCVFDGKLLTTNGTTNCGGFVGWHYGGTTNITNSLYAPAALEEGETEVGPGVTGQHPSATFGRDAVNSITNSYYTRALGTEQGKAPLSVTGGDNVTVEAVSPVGSPVENGTYSVSGITAYAKGIIRGGTFYYGSGDDVSLTLSHGDRTGYDFSGYEASAGTLSGSENPYTLTMPDEDVTITGLCEQASVTLTIGSSGWTTWYDNKSYTLSDGAQAYYVSGIGESTVNLTAIGGVPSGLPVLIHGSGTVTLTAGATEVEVSGNDARFKGTATEITATDFTDFTDGPTYVLYGGKFLLVEGNGGIGAHKCWLTLSGSNARQLNISIGETGLSPCPSPEGKGSGCAWYDLQGRKLGSEPTRKGLYIYKGEKVKR